MIKMALLFTFLFLIVGCGFEDDPRTLSEAYDIAQTSGDFDQLYFVVQANCDYDYFFTYEPMRRGGFYAVGVYESSPQLMIIPSNPNAEEKSGQWPLSHSVNDAIDLLNTVVEAPLDYHDMYQNIRIELTHSVLNDNRHTTYDQSFFIVIRIDETSYIAFEQNQNLVIYHENEGFIASN